jgi:uncharacterized protein
MILRLPRQAVLGLFLTCWSAVLSPALADTLPLPTDGHVLDLAEVLDPTAEARIERLLADTEASTGVVVEVVTMTDISAHGGKDQRLDAYAKTLFNAWGIGSAERNDGILMLVATDTRDVRIALGAGYDAVYDGRAARVLATAVLPEFREDRIAGGIEAGITSTRQKLIAPFLEGRPVTVTEGFETTETSDLPIFGAIAAAVGGIGFLGWSKRRKRKLCPSCGALTLTRRNEVIEPSSSQSSGTGLEHLLCSSCGFTDRRSYTVGRSRGTSDDSGMRSSSRSSSAGGGGSRSGGRSSGGGASGKW